MADTHPEVDPGEDVYGNAITATFTAGGAINAGDLVTVGANDMEVVQAGADGIVVGVAMKAAASGDAVPVLLRGVTKVQAGGAITRGSKIKAGANGKVVTAVTTVTIPAGGTAVTSDVAQPTMTVEAGIACGVALESASADGDYILALIGGA